MSKYILKRLLTLIPTLLAVIFIVYFIMDLTPGDPGTLILGERASQEEIDAKMEKYHMQKAEVKPQSEKTTKKFEKQYLKTDTGIEINIPMEQYQDINQVEFITNPDGTISVLIKNINKISTR